MINCAIIGYGWWGQQISKRLANSQRLKVQLVAEPLAERAAIAREAGFATVDDLAPVLTDDTIDAVLLATPHGLHEAQVCASAAAGKHVFCEKPLGLTKASAQRSLAACHEAGVVLGVGHERRFEPAMVALKERIDKGELGTIMHVAADFSHDKLANVPKEDWRRDPVQAPAAGMTGMGVHLTDLFISTFGPISNVAALTSDRVLGWEAGDVVTAQLGFEAGMTGTISAILKTPLFIRYQVFGSDAWAEVRNTAHPDSPTGIAELVIQRSEAEPERHEFGWSDAVGANLEAFGAAVEGEAPNPYTDEQLLHNVEVLEAIAESARTQTVIQLQRG